LENDTLDGKITNIYKEFGLNLQLYWCHFFPARVWSIGKFFYVKVLKTSSAINFLFNQLSAPFR